MKKIIAVILVFCIFSMISGCGFGSSDTEARAVLNNYLDDISNNKYEEAYELLCKYDKDNIGKELFLKWRESVGKITKFNSLSISEKSDKFGKMEVYGVTYTKSFGFEVKVEIDKLIDQADLEDMYEKDIYKQMVVYENGEWKIGLFYNDLESRTEKYNKLIDENEKK